MQDERFILTVGDYQNAFPDCPPDLPVGIYDRKHQRLVAAINPDYANLICLETTDHGAPFTDMVGWLNALPADAFESEGVPS